MADNGKTRTWTFTNYKMDEDYDRIFAGGDIKYLAWGLETCPSTGNEHHQGYIVFKNQRSTGAGSRKKISTLFQGKPHVEPMRGSLQQNTTYCSKQNALNEWGNRPAQGNRADLDSVVQRLRNQETTAEDICLDDPVYYHMYGRTLERAEDILQRKRFRTEMTKGVWLYGPTGVGKSHRAFEGFTPETHYVKNIEDQWWDGYTGQETVIRPARGS